MGAKKNKEEVTLEEVFEKLEEVIKELEQDIPLEESFTLYHQGMDMLKVCNEKIEKIEKQVLVLDEEGQTQEF